MGLWAVSYFRVAYYSQRHEFLVSLFPGNLELYDVEKARNNGVEVGKLEPGLTIHGFKSFKTFVDPYIRTSRVTHIVLPFWIPVLSFAVLPSLQLADSRRRRKRKKLGLYFECGYNLRGLTELRCPECNTPFEKCSAKP